MQVLQDGLPVTDITPGSEDPYTPGFALVPAPSAAPRASLPGPWLQFMADGVALGDPDIAIVDIVIDASLVTVTRGVGENSHVITIKKPDVLPPTTCLSGPEWTERAAPTAKRWTAVAFGEPDSGVTVLVGNDITAVRACAAYSLDFGVTWSTSPTSFPDTGGYGFRAFALAYGDGRFVGAINATQGFTSEDGINWTLRTQPSLNKIEFGDGRFLASRVNSALCYTSLDGLAWSSHAMPSHTTWGGVGIGSNGTYLIFHNSGCARSTDAGVTWDAAGTFGDTANANCAAYGNGVWVATRITSSTTVRVSSDDGLNWVESNPLQGPVIVWQRVRFVGGIFYVVDVGGLHCYKSTDGMTWTAANSLVNMTNFGADWDCDEGSVFRYVAGGNAGSNTSVVNTGVCA